MKLIRVIPIVNLTTYCRALALSLTLLSVAHDAAFAAPPAPNARIDSVIEQIEFRDVTVGDALKVLSEQSELNIIASKEAAAIPVTMFLRRVTALEVIEALSKTYNLWYQRDPDSNIVRIYTVKEYRLEQVEFKKEETEVFTMKNAKNALDLAETIQNLFSGRVKLSYGQNQQQLMIDMAQRFARFDMLDSRKKQQFTRNIGGGANIRNATTGVNVQTSQITQGNGNQQIGSLNQISRNGNNQDVADTLSNIENMVGQMGSGNADNVGNMLTGDVGDSRELVDNSIRHQAPIYVGVIKHQNRVLVRTRDVDAMNEIREINKHLDMESSMVLLEVKVLSIDLSDGYDSLFDFKLKGNNGNLSTVNATDTIGASEALDTTIRAASASIGNPAMLATVVSNSFETRLQLLEKENRVTKLATPIVLTSNQEVSNFVMGSQVPIIVNYTAGSTTTTAVSNNSAIVQTLPPGPVYELRTIGNTLFLTPNINADNTVSIQVVVEEAALIKDGATIIVPVTGGTPQTQTIDVVNEKTFSGSVIAQSGTAVAVGGMIQESAGGREKKVPLLGDIPGLGFFFREDHQSRERTELVIILKPHVINSPLEAEAISKGVLSQNSEHPNAGDAGSMDIYSNPDRQHKGYVLEKPYKEYSKQDDFDKFRGRGDSREFSQPAPDAPRPADIPANQQVYIDLTRYASEAVRVSGNERKLDPRISPVSVRQFEQADLTYDARIWAMPIAGWRQGGVYVTAVELHNVSAERVTVDYRHLKGRWLASTIESEVLDGQGGANNTTYLYLISSQPFDEIVARNGQ